MDKEYVLKKLKKLETQPTTRDNLLSKNMEIFKVLSNYFKVNYDIDFILVGGLAVDYYTQGKYSTKDIDLIGFLNEKVISDLLFFDFIKYNNVGRHYYNKKLDCAIEFPSSNLDGSLNKLTTIGLSKVIGVDDLIVDRLRSLVHWNSKYQIIYLNELIKQNNIDIDYIKNRLNSKENKEFDSILSINKEISLTNMFEHDLLSFNENSKDCIVYSIYKQKDISLFSFPYKNSYIALSIEPIITLWSYNGFDFDTISDINIKTTTLDMTSIDLLDDIDTNIKPILSKYIRLKNETERDILNILE